MVYKTRRGGPFMFGSSVTLAFLEFSKKAFDKISSFEELFVSLYHACADLAEAL